MKWMKERDLLIAQTMAFVQSVTGKTPEAEKTVSASVSLLSVEAYESTRPATALSDAALSDIASLLAERPPAAQAPAAAQAPTLGVFVETPRAMLPSTTRLLFAPPPPTTRAPPVMLRVRTVVVPVPELDIDTLPLTS